MGTRGLRRGPRSGRASGQTAPAGAQGAMPSAPQQPAGAEEGGQAATGRLKGHASLRKPFAWARLAPSRRPPSRPSPGALTGGTWPQNRRGPVPREATWARWSAPAQVEGLGPAQLHLLGQARLQALQNCPCVILGGGGCGAYT